MTMHAEENPTMTNTEAATPALSYDPKTVLLEEWRDVEIKIAGIPPADPWTDACETGKDDADRPLAVTLSESEYRRVARSFCHAINADRLKKVAAEEREQSKSVMNTAFYEMRRRFDGAPACAHMHMETGTVRGGDCDHDDTPGPIKSLIEMLTKAK